MSLFVPEMGAFSVDTRVVFLPPMSDTVTSGRVRGVQAVNRFRLGQLNNSQQSLWQKCKWSLVTFNIGVFYTLPHVNAPGKLVGFINLLVNFRDK